MRHEEAKSQRALIKWWAFAHKMFKVPEHLLFSVPNGGYRRAFEASLLQQEGSRPGAPDLLLLVPVDKYHGLALEMKSTTGRLRPNQNEFLDSLKYYGYKTIVAYSTEEAVEAITDYLRNRT